jgi:hypothetical protein
MSDYFCDHSAYSSALGTTPTWGVPQEGDGSGKYAATASSIASITFSSVPTSGTFSVCGITISTTGVISAASTSAAATALATNINAVTTTVASGVAIGTPQLRNLVYAQAVGSVCQIMMRIGSAALNTANNVNAQIQTTFNGSPTLSQFTGGVGGCFGWLINDVALGVSSSISIGNYGIGTATNPYVACSTDVPNTQALPGAMDRMWLRSGTGKTISLPASTTAAISLTATGYDQIIVLDSNTRWTEDSGNGIFKVVHNPNNGATGPTLGVANRIKSLSAVKRDSMQLLVGSLGSNNMAVNCSSGSNTVYPTLLENVLIGEELDNQTRTWWFGQNGAFQTAFFRTCTFKTQSPRTDFPNSAFIGTIAGMFDAEDCDFIFNHNTAVQPSPITNFNFTTTRTNLLKFRRCRFINLSTSAWSGGKYKLLKSNQTTFTSTEVIAEDCTGLSLDDYLNISSVINADNPNKCGYYFRSAEVGNIMRLERVNGYAEWTGDPSSPLLNALLPDQTTRWSMAMSWVNTPTNIISPATPFSSPKMVQVFRGTTETTITLEFLVKSTVALSTANAALRVGYVGTDGLMRTATTLYNTSSLSVSSVEWTNAPVGYSAKKLTITLPTSIQLYSEVSATFELYSTSPSGNPELLYIDPQPKIT